MPAQIFGPSYDYVDARLEAVLHDGLSNVIAHVAGPLRIAMVLYVVLYGWAIIRGSITEPIMDGVIRLVKLCFI